MNDSLSLEQKIGLFSDHKYLELKYPSRNIMVIYNYLDGYYIAPNPMSLNEYLVDNDSLTDEYELVFEKKPYFSQEIHNQIDRYRDKTYLYTYVSVPRAILNNLLEYIIDFNRNIAHDIIVRYWRNWVIKESRPFRRFYWNAYSSFHETMKERHIISHESSIPVVKRVITFLKSLRSNPVKQYWFYNLCSKNRHLYRLYCSILEYFEL